MHKRLFEFLCVSCLVVFFPATLISIVPEQKTETIYEEIYISHTVSNTQPTEDTLPPEEQKAVINVSVLKDGAVEQMELEQYILHVVLAEMPATFELEALKAQAVVARTYTVRRQNGKSKHEQAAVCTDASCCQAFKTPASFLQDGGTTTELERVTEAVRQTEGQVLLYNGELIEATYFSCSGGMTEDAAAVWGADIPYLKATESPGEEGANHFVDTVYFTKETFEKALGRDIAGSTDTWFGAITYTSGQGINTIDIGGIIYKGTVVRQLLGLRSTSFVVTAIGNTIVITTKGYGHRVGMSQYGADAMAVQGCDYKEILLHYYSGTELSRISID